MSHAQFSHSGYEGHPIMNETFNSAVNLHLRLMKSCSMLALHFGCSHVPYSMCYIVLIFVASNIRRLGKHTWTAHYRWSS